MSGVGPILTLGFGAYSAARLLPTIGYGAYSQFSGLAGKRHGRREQDDADLIFIVTQALPQLLEKGRKKDGI